MKNRNYIRNLTLSSMFLAMAFVLPFFTGQIKEIGNKLCPMHIPVLLCGFFCGAPWGMAVGFIAPLLRSFITTKPDIYPTAFCMAFELAVYGLAAGWLYRILPKKKIYVYVSLLGAMVLGRMVWGAAMFCCMGLDPNVKFGWNAFLTGAIVNAVPGIIVQIILIPILVISLRRSKL